MLYNQAQRHCHLGRDDVLEHAGTGKRLESHRMFDGLPHLSTELVAIEAFFDEGDSGIELVVAEVLEVARDRAAVGVGGLSITPG